MKVTVHPDDDFCFICIDDVPVAKVPSDDHVTTFANALAGLIKHDCAEIIEEMVSWVHETGYIFPTIELTNVITTSLMYETSDGQYRFQPVKLEEGEAKFDHISVIWIPTDDYKFRHHGPLIGGWDLVKAAADLVHLEHCNKRFYSPVSSLVFQVYGVDYVEAIDKVMKEEGFLVVSETAFSMMFAEGKHKKVKTENIKKLDAWIEENGVHSFDYDAEEFAEDDTSDTALYLCPILGIYDQSRTVQIKYLTEEDRKFIAEVEGEAGSAH